MDKVVIRDTLNNLFSSEEIGSITFELGLDIENIAGDTKEGKVTNLVVHCERIGQLGELVNLIKRKRPLADLININSQKSLPYLDMEKIPSPGVSRPTNLSFEAIDSNGTPAGWFNSVGFVDYASSAYHAQIVVRDNFEKGYCLFFNRNGAQKDEFGSFMQRFPATNLAGTAIRLESELKTEKVSGWAGMWLRADGWQEFNLVFENMSARPLRGTTNWAKYRIEVQLPFETAWLNFGVVLSGSGTLFADNFKLSLWKNHQWQEF